MNCDWVRENISLYLYQELADDARHELEGHASRCAECAEELAAMRRLHEEMSSLPQLEVTPNFLAASRVRLSHALEITEQRRGWRWVLDPFALLRQAKFSPALAAIIYVQAECRVALRLGLRAGGFDRQHPQHCEGPHGRPRAH
jgi:anti-sigma factor RsiW